MKNGFTLIEALVAISILIIGILNGFILVTRALYNVAVIQDRLTASFLAQEGIELVRNIRDTNFIKILQGGSVSWRQGLLDSSSGRCYIIDNNLGTRQGIELKETNCDNSSPLKYDSINKIFTYQSGNDSVFHREIKIETISPNEIRILCTVKWRSKNMNFSLTVEDHLFNWFSI